MKVIIINTQNISKLWIFMLINVPLSTLCSITALLSHLPFLRSCYLSDVTYQVLPMKVVQLHKSCGWGILTFLYRLTYIRIAKNGKEIVSFSNLRLRQNEAIATMNPLKHKSHAPDVKLYSSEKCRLLNAFSTAKE